jgi:rhodanese-related sulfurtransferase
MMSNNVENGISGNGHITILPVGLEDNELRMLKSLCTISSIATGNRNRKYALANPGEGSHIYLIDARKADAYTRWRIANNVENVPALLIADPGYESKGSDKVAHRPLIPSRLLALLDNLPIAAAAA